MNVPARRTRAETVDHEREQLREVLPHVRKWLVRLLGARHPELDDATQEALSEIARFLPKFEGRSKLTTAAHTITVRVAYRYFGRAPVEELDDDPPADASGPEEQVMAREALARLHRCLAKLPAKRRIAFVLCAVEGLTPTEAAAIAGTTALAMRCRLVWARREVERMLAKDPYVGEWIR